MCTLTHKNNNTKLKKILKTNANERNESELGDAYHLKRDVGNRGLIKEPARSEGCQKAYSFQPGAPREWRTPWPVTWSIWALSIELALP